MTNDETGANLCIRIPFRFCDAATLQAAALTSRRFLGRVVSQEEDERNQPSTEGRVDVPASSIDRRYFVRRSCILGDNARLTDGVAGGSRE